MSDEKYDGPTMADAMQDLVDGYQELLAHNREHHPEISLEAAEADFDIMTAAVRSIMQLGIEDTPSSWESVMAGFLLGSRVVGNLDPLSIARLMQGEDQTKIPELLAFHFALAKRWEASADTKGKAILDALAADGT